MKNKTLIGIVAGASLLVGGVFLADQPNNTGGTAIVGTSTVVQITPESVTYLKRVRTNNVSKLDTTEKINIKTEAKTSRTIVAEIERTENTRRFSTDDPKSFVLQVFGYQKYEKDVVTNDWYDVQIATTTLALYKKELPFLSRFAVTAYAVAFSTVDAVSDEEGTGRATCLSASSGVYAGFYIGVYNSSDYKMCPLVRFQSVTIPTGQTITAATVGFTFFANTGGAVATKIYADAADDCVAHDNTNRLSGRTRTVLGNTYTMTWNTSAQTSNDISAAVQEVVSRGGWASGNHLCIIYADDGSWPNSANYSYNTSTGGAHVLTVTYTASGGGSTPATDDGLRIFSLLNILSKEEIFVV